jgi:hypothetical protein
LCGFFLLLAGALLVLAGCAGSGPVVTVTEVSDASKTLKTLELKKDDLAKIQELKKSLVAKDTGTDVLSDILEKSTSYTVAEYLGRYPEGTEAVSDYRIGGYDVLSIMSTRRKTSPGRTCESRRRATLPSPSSDASRSRT